MPTAGRLHPTNPTRQVDGAARLEPERQAEAGQRRGDRSECVRRIAAEAGRIGQVGECIGIDSLAIKAWQWNPRALRLTRQGVKLQTTIRPSSTPSPGGRGQQLETPPVAGRLHTAERGSDE